MTDAQFAEVRAGFAGVHSRLDRIENGQGDTNEKLDQHIGKDEAKWESVDKHTVAQTKATEAQTRATEAQARSLAKLESAVVGLTQRADERSDEGKTDPGPPTDADRAASAPPGGLVEEGNTSVDVHVKVPWTWPKETRVLLQRIVVFGLGVGLAIGAVKVGIPMAATYIAAALTPATEVVHEAMAPSTNH